MESDDDDLGGARAEAPHGARHIVAIGGAKGGVGKSLLAANIGIYLAQLGKRVVLFDADLGAANLHTFVGVERPRLAVGDFFDKRVSRIEDCVLETAVAGLGIVSGEGDPAWTANPRSAQKNKLLSQVREIDCDWLICDLPPGSGFTALDFFLVADVHVMVVVPEPTSVENTFRFVKSAFLRRLRNLKGLDLPSLTGEGGIPAPLDLYHAAARTDPETATRIAEEMARFRPRLVVNQTRSRADLELGPQLRSTGRRRLGLPIDYFGHLEIDDAVWLAVRKRRPLVVDHPDSKVAKNIERVSRRLLALESEKPVATTPPHATAELTFYEALEIDPGASDEEIRRAYRRVRELYAPDSMALGGLFAADRLDALQERIEVAYETLIDADRRRKYDVELFPDGVVRREQPHQPTPRADETPIRIDIPPEPEISADTEFTGELLRRIREARGIDLLDIAQRTKIGAAHLRAIENEHWEVLPAPVYVRGFLVEYARCLRLDPRQVTRTVLDRYQRAKPEPR